MAAINCVNRVTGLSFVTGILLAGMYFTIMEMPRIPMPKTERPFPENGSILLDDTLDEKGPGDTRSASQNLSYKLYPTSLGGFGNHIFNLAGGYGLARTNNRKLLLQPTFFNKIGKIFNTSYLDVETSTIPNNTDFRYFRCCIYEAEKEHFDQRDFKVGLYIQSWRYFEPYSDDLRKRLILRNDRVTEAQNFLRELKLPRESTLVGIHIRRGDMINRNSQEFGRVVPKSRYLQKAMTYYVWKYPNVQFVVCSDDIKWCKQNETYLQPNTLDTKSEYGIHFSPGERPPWDFALLAQCNHSILTVGTFGWWASWLAGGEVVYLNHPVTEGSGAARNFRAEDYFWPTWVGMDDN